MAISLTNSGAGVFDRIGLLAARCRDMIALKGGTATTPVAAGASLSTFGTTLEDYADASPAVSAEIDGHWQSIDSIRSALGVGFDSWKRIAEKILVRMVDVDSPLAQKDVESALKELIRQMVGATLSSPSNDVNASTISLGTQTNGTPTPTGTCKIIQSGKDGRGQSWQTVFAEVIRAACVADAQSATTGGATARQESIRFTGAAQVTDVFSHLYPAGSGASNTLQLSDARLDNSGQNVLYNGSFDRFLSTNTPEEWVIVSGPAGTNVFAAGQAEAATGGTNALKLTGAGGTTITLTHSFDTAATATIGSGGTPYELLPTTQYAICLWVKALSAAPAAGVLRVALRLTDGTTVIADDFAVNNTFDIDLTLITTSYVAYTGTFRVPTVLSTSTPFKLVLTTSTNITNGNSVVIDDVAMVPMTVLYAGGPSVAAFAGPVNPVINDYWTLTNSNTRGLFVDWFQRFFDLNAKGLHLPVDTAAGETLVDTLISGV